MGTTANYSWPYPESSDFVADGATAIENLADAVDTTVGDFGVATTFTPNFAPTAGTWTSNTESGWYMRINDLVIGEAELQITSVGTGGGQVQFVLPVTAKNGNPYSIGTGREANITGHTFNVWRITTSNGAIRFYQNGDSANNTYTFSFFFVYEAA